MRIILLGILAALFFSATFVLNRAMSLEGGHWFWTASLRYVWMLGMFGVWLVLSGKCSLIRKTISVFLRRPIFWCMTGSVGFGVFYAGISFSADYVPGWVVAATWQTTILATPIVLYFFGRKVPLKAMLLTLLIFAGVLVINLEQASDIPLATVLLGALPVIIAAFAYPLGNQLMWEASSKAIDEDERTVLASSLCRVLLLTIGTIPFWLIMGLIVQPAPPAPGQWAMTGLVALFSGVAATTLFLKARQEARTSAQLAAVDSTQSMEVVFSLAGEAILLGGVLPGLLGWSGIALTMLGLLLYLRVQTEG